MQAWLIWGLATSFFLADYLARVSPNVMHHFLQSAFSLNEAGFGILTAAFYAPYVVMQIPVGLLADRFSVRRILTVMALITALGCLVFGNAHNLATASLGRILIGFSAAFAFVCALRLASNWFHSSKLGLLSGLTQASGMIGASLGQTPVVLLVAMYGWRHTMFIIGSLFVILAILLFQFIKDKPATKQPNSHHAESLPVWQSLKIILSHKQTWINALYAGFLFGPTAVIGESFGSAYLQFGRGLTAPQAASAISLIFIGWGIGGPLVGWLSDKIGKRKPLVYFSALCGVLLTSFFVWSPTISATTAYVIFFAFGLTNAGVAIAYAIATEIQPRKVIGVSIAFTNMASIFIGACLQPIVGALLDYVAGARGYHVELLNFADFQFALQLLPLSSLLAFMLAFFIKETNCRPVIF